MDVYEDDSDHFSSEYLAYLGTLTTDVGMFGTARARVSRHPDGEIVRIEIWTPGDEGTYGYMNLLGEKWMKPDYSLE